MSKSYLEKLMISLKKAILIGLVGFFCGLTPFLIFKYTSTNDFIIADTATTLLKTLIEVNVTLLGFWGLIIVYLLNSLNNLRDQAMTSIREILLKSSDLEIKKFENEDAERNKFIEMTLKVMGKTIETYRKGIKNILYNIRITCYSSVIVATIFIVSIILCVFSIGEIDVNGLHYKYLSLSLALMLLGIFSMFSILVTMSTPKQERVKN